MKIISFKYSLFFAIISVIFVSGCTTELNDNLFEDSELKISDVCKRFLSYEMFDLDHYELNKVYIKIDSEGMNYYSVIETIPEGWILNETDGIVGSDGKIRWIDQIPSSQYGLEIHTYLIQPDGSTGRFNFSGECTYGPPDKTEMIGGQNKVNVFRELI